jgi:hypothetical protein
MANFPLKCQNKLRMENGEWRIMRAWRMDENKGVARPGGACAKTDIGL